MDETLHLALGTHFIVDLSGAKNLDQTDDEYVTQILLHKIALSSGATPLKYSYHLFQPKGITATLILSESHVSIHTYPESQKVFLDVFTCGENCIPQNSLSVIKEFFDPENISYKIISRGDFK